MSNFQSGKRDGYIYGYIFHSGNKGLVLDEGPNEYPINSAELLINGQFVVKKNLTLDVLKSNSLYGSKARIKQNTENELVQYHVVNIDLIKEFKVPGSKMGIQMAHGATIIAANHGQEPKFLEWYNDGKKQKKIALRGKAKELEKLIELGAYPVYDNGHNWVPPGSLTEVVFPPMTKDEAPKLLKRLQVYTGEEHLQ